MACNEDIFILLTYFSNKNGWGQSGTYLRQTRASSSSRVSVAKAYRVYHDKENLERHESNKKWKGGQSGTYLRLTIGVVGSAGEHRKT